MRTIGRYAIRGLLGRGGMGAVYKVELPGLPRMFALKLLSPSDMAEALTEPGELERRFNAEARTMAAIRHPNVAGVLDLDRDESGRPYFVMEYLCNNLGAIMGETYRVERPSRILPVKRSVDYARQILLGLSRLHFAGIVHRDVKPFNILVGDDGTVKIIDFGLSKLRGETMKRHPSERVGSPYYAAPEQERDPESVDLRADLYAVGVMLFRMLAGCLPGPDVRAASQANPDLHPGWDGFLVRAMAPDPDKRFSSAMDMLDALDEVERAWTKDAAMACSLRPEDDGAGGVEPDADFQSPDGLRCDPAKISPRLVREALTLDDLYRPRAYPRRDFRPLGGDLVHDRTTGLVWQRQGSPYPLTMAQALAYVKDLDAGRACGRTGWRLPTAEELCSLLAPPGRGDDLCQAPVFGPDQSRIWSSDLKSFVAAWTVDVELGFIGWHDFTCYNFVRAVCAA